MLRIKKNHLIFILRLNNSISISYFINIHIVQYHHNNSKIVHEYSMFRYSYEGLRLRKTDDRKCLSFLAFRRPKYRFRAHVETRRKIE